MLRQIRTALLIVLAGLLLVACSAPERSLILATTTSTQDSGLLDDLLPAFIASSGAVFVSRGDDSGTHARERSLWQTTGITPGGNWYTETGQGMGATLRVAAERGGYTLADRATYLSQPGGLALLVEGDPGLLNVYHVIEMTDRAGGRVQPDAAAVFADWITGTVAQQLIGEFGLAEYGRPLFVPDAGKPEPVS